MTKTFTLAAVLKVASGRKLNDDGMDGVVELMSHIAGRPLWTHQIPRDQPGCAAWILAGYPQLSDLAVQVRSVPADELPNWLQRQQEMFGNAFQINPVPAALQTLGQDAK